MQGKGVMVFTMPTEVVKANLVLVGFNLLSAPDEFQSFRRAIGTDVQMAGAGIATNIQSGISEPQRSLAVNKDRIALELSSSRSMISRDYPSREDLGRLAEVAWQAIANTSLGDQRLQAFGFNVEMVFDQGAEASAFGYLSRRLFAVESLGGRGWQFVGGAGRLIFDESERRWTIQLEPRFNDENESRVFLSANLHVASRNLSKKSEIEDYLKEIWDEVHDFVQRLDERGP